MRLTTYQGSPAYQLTEAPDWSQPVEMRVSVPTVRERSLAGREARRPRGATLRCGLSWTATLQGPEALRELLQSLQDNQNDPILVPCWPLAVPGHEWADQWDAGSVVAWDEGFSAVVIGPAAPTGWDWVAPLLRCSVRVESQTLTHGATRVRFTAEENGDASEALTFPVQSWTQGPALADTSRPAVFPFLADWREQPTAGAAEIEADRRNIGGSRTTADAVYPQTGERIIAARVTVTNRAETAKLLRWWQDQAAAAHFVSGEIATAQLTADAVAGSSTLAVADVAHLGEDRFLTVSIPGALSVVRVASISAGTITLTEPLTASAPIEWATITPAALVRHASDVLTIAWTMPGMGHAKVAWREVPAEYTIAAGESRGITIGALPVTAHLYTVTIDRLGSAENHRFTDWEGSLTTAGFEWTAAPVEHSEIRQTLAMDRDEVTLKTRWDPAGPWRMFLPGAMDGTVRLSISVCRVTGAAGVDVAPLWSGEITGAEFEGPFVHASAAGANAILDRDAPRFLMQRGCNHALFDSRCGLDRAAWQFTATIGAKTGNQLTLAGVARGDGLPTGWDGVGFFALGYLEATEAGAVRRYSVWASDTGPAAGEIVVTLGGETSAAVGASVALWPGCDGEWPTCIRFANGSRFGGFPHLPDRAPQFTPEKKSSSTTGKK